MASEHRWTSGAHPTPEQLLLAREEELPREDAEPILAHLHQCWQCCAQVERQKRGIDAYFRFRETRLNPALTPRPGAWLRMSARLRQPAEAPAPAPARSWRRRAMWFAIPAAIAAAIVAVVLLTPPRLTADVVLDRALRAQTADGATAARVVIRRGSLVVASDDATLRQARIDPSRPLSVASFRTWRDSLQSKQDSVRDAGADIRVETTTAEGAIALASVTVAREDYRPRAKHVELRDGAVIDVDAVEAPVAAPFAGNRATASPGVPTLSNGGFNAAQSEILEMDVRWALHGIDADLGEPFEIQSTEEGVTVSGTVDDAARRDQIEAALRGLPHVATRLTLAAADADLLERAQPIETSGAAANPLLASELAKDFPNGDARHEFVAHALHVSRDILRYSWALRRLADRYPVSAEAALPPAALQRLQTLVAEHARHLHTASQEAAAVWKPFVEMDDAAPPLERSWQAAAARTLQAAESFDHLTSRLLISGENDVPSAEVALRQMQQAHQSLAVPFQENR